jgi:hypothetical protein
MFYSLNKKLDDERKDQFELINDDKEDINFLQ